MTATIAESLGIQLYGTLVTQAREKERGRGWEEVGKEGRRGGRKYLSEQIAHYVDSK